MTRLRKLMAVAAFASIAPAILAQTTGTLTITGTTPEAFALTNDSNTALSSSLALGTLTPGTGNTLTTQTAAVRLRSNKAYTLSAQAGALTIPSPGSVDNGSSIAVGDIGFGIRTLVNTGTNVANTGSRTETIATAFDYTAGFPTPTNGLTPSFTATLNNISSNTEVLRGQRISSKGNISTDNNFITVTFGAAALPQFFTPNTGFSAAVTLTIASQ